MNWRKNSGLILSFTVCLAVGVVAGALAAPNKPMVVIAFEDAKFVVTDPARPNGPRTAVLMGDPETGPSTMLLELKKGTGRLHVHSSDYHLVVVRGTMKHWTEREPEARVKPLGPGSYWFQPGNEPHGDSCLSDECLMFISWVGKRDGKYVEASKN
jgi:quercetin dioxygenase-like cupin family protein